MMYAPGLLRPAALRHLPQCVMNGFTGYKSLLRPGRRRPGPENLVVHLYPWRQILSDLIAGALFRRRARADERLAGFNLNSRPVDVLERELAGLHRPDLPGYLPAADIINFVDILRISRNMTLRF
jgi:hypothetical protein